jgi:hypothetical protein
LLHEHVCMCMHREERERGVILLVCNKLDFLSDQGSISAELQEVVKREVVQAVADLLGCMGASHGYECETVVDGAAGLRVLVRGTGEGVRGPVLNELQFCFISCKNDANIDGLVAAVNRLALASLGSGSADARPALAGGEPQAAGGGGDVYSLALTQREDSYVTRERHRQHLAHCSERLDRILAHHAYRYTPLDVLAEELRLAMRDLGLILGRVDVEELLDVIFRDFCIGK